MTTRLNGFEQFMLLFRELKRVAGTPQRLVTFHQDIPEIGVAWRRLQYEFLLRFDFKRRVDAGNKLFRQVPDGFKEDWTEYKEQWAPAIAHVDLLDILPELSAPYDPNRLPEQEALEAPDPDYDSSFDPVRHDGAKAFEWAIWLLDHELEFRQESQFEDDEAIANRYRIALGAVDYVIKTIGLDVQAVFRRWQALPPIFMPAFVSNKHGKEKGSLNNLLDDAIRAYVCGAPAAALVLCRSTIEMLLNKHCNLSEDELFEIGKDGKPKTTKDGRPLEKSLRERIAAAERHHEIWRQYRLYPRLERINNLIHDYSRMAPLDPNDDKFLRDILMAIKTLIESSPRPA